MSGISMLKSGLVLSTCVAGLTLSACASNHGNDSRYGVSDYESGSDCTVSPCGPVAAAPVADSRYGSVGGQTVQSESVVYANCGTATGVNCAPAPAPVYTQPAPAPVYTQPAPAPVYTAPTTQYSGPITCPAGTKDAGDGTCMQMSSSSTYTGSTYTGSTSTTGSTSYASGPVDCPAGTKDAGDGTCMMSSGGSLSSIGSSSSYTGSSAVLYDNTSATQYADCPAGSTRSASGSCTVSSGYVAAPTYTPPTSYLPIRK